MKTPFFLKKQTSSISIIIKHEKDVKEKNEEKV